MYENNGESGGARTRDHRIKSAMPMPVMAQNGPFERLEAPENCHIWHTTRAKTSAEGPAVPHE